MSHPTRSRKSTRHPVVTIECRALENKKIEYVIEPDQPRRYLAVSGAIIRPVDKERREVSLVNRGEPAGSFVAPRADAEALLGRMFLVRPASLPAPGETATVALR
jgi:hypothetical protein